MNFSIKNFFNPHISKQTPEIIFPISSFFFDMSIYHHSLTFNDIPVGQSYSQKHLRIVLDNKLNLEEHLKFISKVNIIIGVIRGFQNVLPRPPPPTIYKSFIRSHLNYGHIIYTTKH